MSIIKSISEFTKDISELIDDPSNTNSIPDEFNKNAITYPVLFMYSHKNEEFETSLIKILKEEDCSCISTMSLRCRFNSHRDIKIYSIRIRSDEYETLDKLIETNPKETFYNFSNRSTFLHITH